MVSTRSKTGAAAPHSPVKTITKRRHDKPSPLASSKSPKRSASAPPVFPNLTLHDDTGAIISTHSLLTDQTPGLILFTYPRANTGGCTTQAKGLSDLQQSARNAGYNIVGCSYDSVKSQAAWKVKRSISVPLLCDTPSIGLLRKLSVHKAPRSAKRSVFVITRQHDKLAIVLAKRAVSPKDSIALMEQYIRDHPLTAQAPSANDHPMTEGDKPQQLVASDTTKPEEEEPPADEPMTDAPAKPHDNQPPKPTEESAPKPQQQPEPKPAEELPLKPAEDAPKPQPKKEQSSDKPQPTSATKQPQPPSPPADKPAESAIPAEKPSDDKPKSNPEPTPTDPASDPNTNQPADTKTTEESNQSDPPPPAKASDEKPVVGMDVEKPQQDSQA